jgi:hypothetical protein
MPKDSPELLQPRACFLGPTNCKPTTTKTMTTNTDPQAAFLTPSERLAQLKAEMIAEMEAAGVPIPPGNPSIETLLAARFRHKTR